MGLKFLHGYFFMSEVYLSVLLILHIYWQYLFIKMLYTAIFMDKVVDMQNDVLNQTGDTKEVEEGEEGAKEENKVKAS